MTSEELELSLRTEFESYFKGILAEMRQDVSDFQRNFEAEFEKHKAQMDDAFRNLSTRFESERQLDKGFTGSIVEHLRLSRDEGAQLAATAFTEAEHLRGDSGSATSYDQIREAVNDISSKTTQSAILRALVHHAGNFAPRGAFFIVKNDNFVGWKTFGREASMDDASVREISFPTFSGTLLADATNALQSRTQAEAHGDDASFLGPLSYLNASNMFAVPLTARGRGVAVMYADAGSDNGTVNADALETLVRVAGLTVELHAAAQSAKAQPSVEERKVEHAPEPVAEPVAYAPAPAEEYVPAPAEEVAVAAPVEETAPAEVEQVEVVEEPSEYTGAVAVQESDAGYYEPVPAMAVEESDAGYFEPIPEEPSVGPDFETTAAEAAPEPAKDFAFSGTNGSSYEAAPEPAVEVASTSQTRSRYGDRNVDLPIEVEEGERRDHNDARRFARLLVSEIKLYNEQKVKEGRDSRDLYDRLREAIDRSREMYEKRVKPPVASKFDYFHYELVNNLADGDDAKLGGSYPGASV